MSHDDFDFEPVKGLPSLLPEGENMLWQGAPSWRAVARRVFHIEKIAIYFCALLAWRFGYVLYSGLGTFEATLSALRMAPLGLAAGAILLVFAWAIGRTTVYTITNRRVVMRFGMALPMTINLPFKQIGTVGLDVSADATGDIPLGLVGGGFGYIVLWPHARPFYLSKPQPMMRCIPEAAKVAAILSNALGSTVVASGRPVAETKSVAWPKLAAAE